MKINNKICIISAAVLITLLIFGVVYSGNHVFVGGHAYPKNAASMNLRGQAITTDVYDQLTASLPGCSICWDVPFQGGAYPDDTKMLRITDLTDEDLCILPYFPELETINAVSCTDYPQLMQLKEQMPDLELQYTVNIDGKDYPQDTNQLIIGNISDSEIALLQYLPALTSIDASRCTDLEQLRKLQETVPGLSLDYQVSVCGENYDRYTEELTLTDADAAELAELFFHMPSLRNVTLLNPKGSADALLSLVDTYPDIQFFWQTDILSIPVTSTDTEVNLSGTQPESLEHIENAMAYFPSVDKLILCDLGFDNETMAAFREKVRQDYKVVWNVEIGYLTLRTDETTYMPGKYNLGVTDEQAYNLRYCEDMICIDVGHKPLFNCEWAAFMPNLKYLIIADTMISDISPLEGLDQLIYLEMFITKVTDLTPLLTCTALQDLNLCYTHADPEPVTKMTWLKNLWWAEPPMEENEFQQYLPDTHLMFLHHSSTGNGWRQLQNYYDMRDILGMHYMWG